MLEITVLNSNQYSQTTLTSRAFRIGSVCDKNQLVIDDPLVSDYQCRIELVDYEGEEQLKITNLGGSMVIGNNSRIHHLVVRYHRIPCCLGAGDSIIQITRSEPSSNFDHSLQQMEIIGSSEDPDNEQMKCIAVSPSPETLSSWFEALGTIQRSTAGQIDFFNLAARSVFNPGGLDGCLILRKSQGWDIVGHHIPYPTDGIFYRRDLVEQAAQTKRPLFHDNSMLGDNDSGNDLHAAVVCPVLDERREVQAMVYGFRNCQSNNNRRGIRLLESKFVNLIADSISAGMIRLDQEADRARQRVLLEQAFSPEVAKQLESNPDFLKGQEREVTVLFADLRGFCRISESVGATVTYQLLTDVMNRFTKIVHEHHGVVIDFYGDGVSAFWNAPVEQEAHAALACQAGVAINKAMNALNAVWAAEIGQRLKVGVGINTGVAQVGNSGSQNRLKYGPQGSVVNVASRLEQSTKLLGVNVVVSESTAISANEEFVTRRICNVKLDGFNDTMAVYTLVEPIEFSKQSKYYEIYKSALELFEQENYVEALDVIMTLSEAEQDTAQPMLEFLLNQINCRIHGDGLHQELADKLPIICLN